MNYTADFETNNSETECRVWSWGCCNIENPDLYVCGKDIFEFIQFMKDLSYEENTRIWFHNLKFDGEFILCFLLSNGFKHTTERKLKSMQFSTLISDMGIWYVIKICFNNECTVTINDSYKVLPFSVADVAKSFGFEESKGKIDYDTVRPIGYEPTSEEKEYQKTDCVIMAKALRRMFSEGMGKITAGSNALYDFKSRFTKKEFEHYFPKLSNSEDDFIRKSYRGAWVYTNKKFKNKPIKKGRVYDVNSLYPSRMYYEMFPYGSPVWFNGAYKEDNDFPLYVIKFECSFDIKSGYFPSIQIKKSKRFLDTEYVESSNGEIVELTMTNIDYEMFRKFYNVSHLYFFGGFKFKAVDGKKIFGEYIDYWMNKKIKAELSGDKAMRTLAKLYQNSLYGKFAKRPKGNPKLPSLEDGVLKLTLGEEEEQQTLYIPVGTFITAYARRYTITAALKEKDRFLYADTDSLHLLGDYEAKNIDVHKTQLGKWKHESSFIRAWYIGAKAYIEEEIHTKDEIEKYIKENPEDAGLCNMEMGTILKVTCAGLPAKLHNQVTYDNFRNGVVYKDKLMPKHVKGGVMLKKTTFEIRCRKNS